METTQTQNPIIELSPSLSMMVDELGSLQDQADSLKLQIDSLKTAIKAYGAGRHLGERFQSLVSPVKPVETINWKAIANHFNPSRQLITAHTSYTDPTLRIVTTLQKGKING